MLPGTQLLCAVVMTSIPLGQRVATLFLSERNAIWLVGDGVSWPLRISEIAKAKAKAKAI